MERRGADLASGCMELAKTRQRIQWLQEKIELIHVKHLEECLVQSKPQ